MGREGEMSEIITVIQTVNSLRTDVYEGRKLVVTTINYWDVKLVESLIRHGLDLTEAASITSNCCDNCTHALRTLCSLEHTELLNVDECEFCERVNELVETLVKEKE